MKRVPQEESGNNVYILLKGEVTPAKCPFGLVTLRSLITLCKAIFKLWKWQPTPVFLPGESQGQGSLVGCRLWGHTESDTTEVTWQQQQSSE